VLDDRTSLKDRTLDATDLMSTLNNGSIAWIVSIARIVVVWTVVDHRRRSHDAGAIHDNGFIDDTGTRCNDGNAEIQIDKDLGGFGRLRRRQRQSQESRSGNCDY